MARIAAGIQVGALILPAIQLVATHLKTSLDPEGARRRAAI